MSIVSLLVLKLAIPFTSYRFISAYDEGIYAEKKAQFVAFFGRKKVNPSFSLK